VHQIRFRPGLCPGPHSGGAYSALSDPLAGLRGLTSIGRRGKGEGKGREEGKTKEREGPPSQIPGSAPAIDDDDDVVGAEMLKQSDMRRQDASVRCLEVLTSSKPNYWKQLLEAGQSHSFTPSCNVSVILLSGVIAAFSVASMGAKSKSKKRSHVCTRSYGHASAQVSGKANTFLLITTPKPRSFTKISMHG